jgi:hypothetical protein
MQGVAGSYRGKFREVREVGEGNDEPVPKGEGNGTGSSKGSRCQGVSGGCPVAVREMCTAWRPPHYAPYAAGLLA